MKVSIDRGTCIGCSACWTNCPKVFEQDPDDGLSRIVEKFRTHGSIAVGEVPNLLHDDVQLAVDDCPVTAISIE